MAEESDQEHARERDDEVAHVVAGHEDKSSPAAAADNERRISEGRHVPVLAPYVRCAVHRQLRIDKLRVGHRFYPVTIYEQIPET